MWSDMLTKLRQGKAFHKFCDHLMNTPEDYDDEVEHLKTHPDLLLETKDKKDLLSTDTGILMKALGSTETPKTNTPNVNFTSDTNVKDKTATT